MKKTSLKERRMRAERTVEALEKLYPDSGCSLEYKGEAWKLLVMGRLSAQCTDARVNVVCAELFSEYPNAKALGEAPIEKIEGLIRSCGLYKMKARDIKEECNMLVCKYGGVLPNSMDELLEFPGVGRKIANLLLGDLYNQDVIVSDTHCIRISGRLGLLKEETKDPHKVEKYLLEVVPQGKGTALCHRFVDFGRDICNARAPKCDSCPLCDICIEKAKNK